MGRLERGCDDVVEVRQGCVSMFGGIRLMLDVWKRQRLDGSVQAETTRIERQSFGLNPSSFDVDWPRDRRNTTTSLGTRSSHRLLIKAAV